MVQVIVLALLAIGIGLIVWAADRRHTRYGSAVPAGVAVVAAVLTWIILSATGLAADTNWTWLTWLAPLAAAVVLPVLVSAVLGRSREQHDVAQLTEVLKRA
ncbi:hypothetical protein [Psychromicrobium xiongbiense]|uniref:hypothetical protein n=1 Tax=Psychromicrobium xiongbiense TaxID=3051184 RepID=UPI002556CB78|nr:hypothetical protein [Psychromicrobium sp. YIM S02556]